MIFEQPVASTESFAVGNENGRANGNGNQFEEFDAVICSRTSQDKRSRKASTVRLNFAVSIKILKICTFIAFFLSTGQGANPSAPEAPEICSHLKSFRVKYYGDIS